MGQLTFQATLGGAVNLAGPNTASTTTFTLPAADGTNGQALTTNGTGTLAFATVGNVVGPASSTDNAIARFDSTTGKLIQNSTGILTDAGAISGLTTISAAGRATFAATAFGAISASTGTVESNSLYGALIGGYGSQYDVMLVNRNGAEALGVIANTQNLITPGTLQCALAISVGGATPTTSGGGITFPATQLTSSNANTLDDYEEGTFTPTTANFTIVGTATFSGSYTKIGNRFLFEVNVTATTTIAGTESSSYIILPFGCAVWGTGSVSNQNGPSYGNGPINTAGYFFSPTFAGTNQRVSFSGQIQV